MTPSYDELISRLVQTHGLSEADAIQRVIKANDEHPTVVTHIVGHGLFRVDWQMSVYTIFPIQSIGKMECRAERDIRRAAELIEAAYAVGFKRGQDLQVLRERALTE